MLAGQDIEAFYASIANRDLLWIGLNCATGPDFMTDHLRTLAEICALSDRRCVPNAGSARRGGPLQRDAAESLAQKLERFVADGWVNIIGGCCGTTPEHIRTLARDGRGHQRARKPSSLRRSVVSGIETAGDRRGHAPGDRRRAHQRARQPQVQAADRRRARSRRRRRSAACRCAAARTCSTSACRIPTATRSPT